jgi:O-antigen ligase
MVDKLIKWCDRVMVFSFYALIYFLPISIALTEIFSGLAILFYLIKRGAILFNRSKNSPGNLLSQSVLGRVVSFLKAFKPRDNYLNKPFAAFLFVNFVSILISQNPSSSFEGFLGKILQGVFIFFTFFECMRSPGRLKVFLIIFAVSNLLICSNGFYQYFVGHEFIHGQLFDGRISSSFRQANDYATYLVVVAATLFYLFLYISRICRKTLNPGNTDGQWLSFFLKGKTRGIILVLFIASLISLGLTYSRGAWIAFVLAIFLLGLKNWRVLIPSMLIAGVFLFLFYPKLNENRDPITSFKAFADYNNRLGYWSRSIHVIRDYPVLGTGVNTYSTVQWRYENEWGWGGYPHNSYLQMTAETGVVGLLSFLWLLFSLYKNSFRNLKKMQRPELRFLLISFLTGLSGLLIHSFFDTTLYSVQLSSFMWLLMGLIVALQYAEEPNPENPLF